VPERPEIVCICGSTRFVDEMSAANRDLTFAGVIVVAPGVFLRAEDHEADDQHLPHTGGTSGSRQEHTRHGSLATDAHTGIPRPR
jgi:hypothetical protein